MDKPRVPKDRDLMAAARAGDREAVGELFARHREAARRFAATLAPASAGNELVSEAFTKILAMFGRGTGPDQSFRAYLFATIRTIHLDQARRRSNEVLVDDFTESPFEPLLGDGVEARNEAVVVADAFRSLPDRWRTVLWLTEVDELPLDEAAARLGMNRNSVAALSFRAREALRSAYLAQHVALADNRTADCAGVLELVPRYVRGSLRVRSAKQVDAHIDSCASCALAVAELAALNSDLRALLVPALLLAGLVGPGVVAGLAGASSTGAGGLGGAAAAGVGALVATAVAAAVAVAVVVPGGEMPSEVPALPSSRAVAPSRAPGPEPARSRPSAPRPTRPAPNRVAPPAPPTSPGKTPRASPSPPASSPAPPQPSAVPSAGSGSGTVLPGLLEARSLPGDPPGRYHLDLPVAGTAQGPSATIRVEGAVTTVVHTEQAYGDWRCESDGPVLHCRLIEHPDRSRALSFDVTVAGVPVDVRVTISSADHVADRSVVLPVAGPDGPDPADPGPTQVTPGPASSGSGAAPPSSAPAADVAGRRGRPR
ncbi:sigma-70 family RNA polymerase sigma factor [Marmoricola sp. RAF53]|uniref:sigma-70 family RNA polymerase sigma factor n=1 Tax=Marmoricola sp. RAF53 TaxID=3233059 RepID=UPI003F948224